MSRFTVWAWMAVGVLAFLSLPGQVFAQEPADSEAIYRSPEEFAARGAIDDYVDHAKEFLANHPHHPTAPRAAFELLMVASVKRDTQLAEEASGKLLLDHAGSMQSAYLVMQYGQNHALYKAFLQNQFERLAPTLNIESAVKFCRATELGTRQWGPAFLVGDDFLLQVALAAKVGGVLNLQLYCREKLRSAAEPVRQIAEISLSDRSAADKFTALAGIHDSKPARQQQGYFYRQLSEAEQALPEVRREAAATLLVERKFALALPIIESLLEDSPDDQLLYWKAWCLASKGQEPAAIAVLATLVSKYPDSPYASSAAELSDCFSSLVQNLDRQAAALHAVLEKLRAGEAEKIEGRFAFTTKAGEKGDVSLAIDASAQEAIEVLAHYRGEPVLGFRSSPSGYRVFTRGEAAIHHYATGKVHFAPQIALQPGPDGNFQFSWAANLRDSPGGLTSALSGLLSSPLLYSKESIAAMIRHDVARGGFPMPVRETSGIKTYGRLVPQAHSPELERTEVTIDANHHLAGFRHGAFVCESLRYGASDDFKLTALKWPEIPTVEQPEFDGPTMFRVMASVLTLFQEPAK